MALLKNAANAAAASKKSGRRKGGTKVFFKGVMSELKKVHWPDKKQLTNYTGVVIIAVLIMATVISLYDWIITSLLGLIIA